MAGRGGAGRALPAVASGALTCVCVCVLQIFEWWYFRKYGTSFIEQVSVSHLRPLLGGVDNSAPSAANAANGEADSSRQSVSGERPSAGRAAPRCAVAAGLWRFCLCCLLCRWARHGTDTWGNACGKRRYSVKEDALLSS